MQRLVSLSCPFSKPVLCFMRSSNIIEKLATSPFVCSALLLENENDNTFATGVFSVRRMIVGYILHFAAVEISAMLTTGHFTRPETLYRALLESSELVAELQVGFLFISLTLLKKQNIYKLKFPFSIRSFNWKAGEFFNFLKFTN